MTKINAVRTRTSVRDSAEHAHHQMMRGRWREDVSEHTLQRVCSEFLEMPGLRLTCRQAQRLWQLDEPTCLQLLEYLVEAKFLCRLHGMYARLTDGRVDYPHPRPA